MNSSQPQSTASPAQTYEDYFVPGMFRPWAEELLARADPQPGNTGAGRIRSGSAAMAPAPTYRDGGFACLRSALPVQDSTSLALLSNSASPVALVKARNSRVGPGATRRP